MDRTDKVRVKGVEVAPRDVLAAITPDPAKLGDRMTGRAIVGTWVIGRKDGQPREVYLYQMTDAAEVLARAWSGRGRLADRLQPGDRDGAARPRGVVGRRRARPGGIRS